ncbi:MAG: CoA-binding protein [Dehalococcoidia bacterium]
MDDLPLAEVMRRIFEPRTLAIVGVPRGPGLGRMFVEGQTTPGYTGELFLVNPSGGEIMGYEAHTSLEAIGHPVDQAIVVAPTGAVPAILEDAARAGVRLVVLFTSGFDELGTPEGRARGDVVRGLAGEHGIRLIGPNCMGVFTPVAHIGPMPNMPSEVGRTAYLSQSGSLMLNFVREGAARGVPAAKAVSFGNQIDLQAADFLQHLAEDDSVDCIGLYLEGAPSGRALFEALRAAARRKPVVLWKSGRTEGGARAAQSHTGALTGTNKVWQAMLRQTGAIPAREIDDVLDTVEALHVRPRLAGSRIALITSPGGPSVSAVDALEEAGLRLATLAPETIERLRQEPELAGVGVSPKNPIDLGFTQGSTGIFARVTRIVGPDPNIDGFVVFGTGGNDEAAAKRYADELIEAKLEVDRPLVLVGRPPEAALVARYAEAGILIFPTAERAVRALARTLEDRAFRLDVGAPLD